MKAICDCIFYLHTFNEINVRCFILEFKRQYSWVASASLFMLFYYYAIIDFLHWGPGCTIVFNIMCELFISVMLQ